jgi:hypothetical protein
MLAGRGGWPRKNIKTKEIMTTILIILIVVTVVAVIASIVSDGGKKEEPPVQASDIGDKSTEYFGSLNDRNTAALNYEKMLRSLKENSHDFRDIPPQAMKYFDHMATHLATIGNNADPQEWKKSENGLPPLWSVEDGKHIKHDLNDEKLCEKSNSEES